jgi:NADH dehydrogenase FAD-containing subunit
MENFAIDTFGMHSMALTSEIARLGIGTYLSTTVKGVTGEGVSCANSDGSFLLPADTVVYATGQKPLREEAFALSFCAPEFYQIGDCAAPKNIMVTTQEAYIIARDIGRI